MGGQLSLTSPNPLHLSITAAYLGQQVTFIFLLRIHHYKTLTLFLSLSVLQTTIFL